jgi:hypothetical protein
MNADPKIHTPRNTNFIAGGGNSLFLPWKASNQRETVPNPKPDIQRTGSTNLVENDQADDRSLLLMTLPFQFYPRRLVDILPSPG